MTMIEVQNLIKTFDKFNAVDDISFTINKNEIFAFLGPNGAGKSTTIKMMTTMLFPTSGKIKINNYNVNDQKNEVRKSIGVIFQDHTLDDDLTAYENLYYHSVLYNIPKKEIEKRIKEMLEYVGLLDKKDILIKKFSGGMKRRIEIARGLLHSPKILFLDEPTLGLDVQTRSFLWNHIKKINEEQKITIFFTTHNLDEAEKIATKIAIIDKGKILIQGTSDEIKKSTKTKSLEDAFLQLTGYNIREQNADNLDRLRKRMRR
ncbi:MAG: ABC transporter ATP-binding protein [Candidatus Woesearchaeota archaeon]